MGYAGLVTVSARSLDSGALVAAFAFDDAALDAAPLADLALVPVVFCVVRVDFAFAWVEAVRDLTVPAAFVLALALRQLPPWRETLGHIGHKWVFIRSVLDGTASLVYLSALFNMPLANATAINMSTPLLIALLSALLLQHRISWRHWLIIGLGFVGVLCVVQPQAEGFTHWAWVALAALLVNC